MGMNYSKPPCPLVLLHLDLDLKSLMNVLQNLIVFLTPNSAKEKNGGCRRSDILTSVKYIGRLGARIFGCGARR